MTLTLLLALLQSHEHSTVVTFGTHSIWISSVMATFVLAIKIASIVRVNQLPRPEDGGCAVLPTDNAAAEPVVARP